MTSLDTNVILRFLLNDIPQQAMRVNKLISHEQVYVSDVVIIEVIYVLEKVMHLPRPDIATLITEFLGFPSVSHNQLFLLAAIEKYEQFSALSIVDCYAAVEADAYRNTLVSFDKRLINQGGPQVHSLAR